MPVNPALASRQFQQHLVSRSRIGFDENPSDIPSNLGNAHPTFVGDAEVTPHKATTFGSFQSTTAWRAHKDPRALPQPHSSMTFGSTFFEPTTEFNIPESHTGKPKDNQTQR